MRAFKYLRLLRQETQREQFQTVLEYSLLINMLAKLLYSAYLYLGSNYIYPENLCDEVGKHHYYLTVSIRYWVCCDFVPTLCNSFFSPPHQVRRSTKAVPLSVSFTRVSPACNTVPCLVMAVQDIPERINFSSNSGIQLNSKTATAWQISISFIHFPNKI